MMQTDKEAAERLLKNVGNNVRRLSHELIPPRFDNASLSELVCTYCQSMSAENGTIVKPFNTETKTDASHSEHAATLYTYDDEGNLISEQITDIYGKTSKYIYQYGKIDVVNGIESGIDDARGSIIVTGRNIHVAGAQGLALYSLSGTLVSQSTSDVIEAPTSGLYILTSKDKKTKIIVK